MAIVIDRNSKADTRLLIDRVNYGLDIDISQWRTNLTNNTTYFTSTDTRLAVQSPREISMVVNLDTVNARILLNWGNTAGTVYIYRIDFSAATTVRFGHNNASLLTMALPGTPTVTPKAYLIHWSTEYDNFSATYYSEMAICDIAANVWSLNRIDHSQPQAPVAAEQFNLGGYGAGVNILTDGITRVDYCRIGCRFHSTTEGYEDWVSQSSAPSLTGSQPTPELAPTSTSFFTEDPNEAISNALLDDQTFAGPIEYVAVVNAESTNKRLFSPFVNVVYQAPPTLQNTFSPTNFYYSAPNLPTPDYYLMLGHIYICSFPSVSYCNAAKARIHVQSWIAAGAPGGTAVDITLKLSFLFFDISGNKAPAVVANGPEINITTNNTSTGLGQWYSFGTLNLPANYLSSDAQWVKGTTYGFGLSIKYGSGTGNTYLRIKIKALSIEPIEV